MTEQNIIRHNMWRLGVVQIVPASLGFVVPFLVIFWQEQGLAFHQIMTLQAVYSVVSVLAEVPSGYVADRMGRGRCVSLGLLLAAVGSFFYTLQPCYPYFVMTEVFLALGFACISGADTALLYDSLRAANREFEFAQLRGRLVSVGMYAAGVTGLLGGILWQYSPQPAWMLVVVAFVVGLGASWGLIEAPHRGDSAEACYSTRGIFATARRELFADAVARTGLAVGVTIFVALQVAFWLYQPYWQAAGVPVAMFGVLFALMNLVSAMASQRAASFGGRLTRRGKLLFLVLGTSAALLLTGLGVGSWLGVLVSFAHQVCRGLRGIWLEEMLNHRFSSELRATMGSLVNLCNRLFYAIALIPVGYLVESVGLGTSYQVLSLMTIGVGLLLIGRLLFSEQESEA